MWTSAFVIKLQATEGATTMIDYPLFDARILGILRYVPCGLTVHGQYRLLGKNIEPQDAPACESSAPPPKTKIKKKIKITS